MGITKDYVHVLVWFHGSNISMSTWCDTQLLQPPTLNSPHFQPTPSRTKRKDHFWRFRWIDSFDFTHTFRIGRLALLNKLHQTIAWEMTSNRSHHFVSERHIIVFRAFFWKFWIRTRSDPGRRNHVVVCSSWPTQKKRKNHPLNKHPACGVQVEHGGKQTREGAKSGVGLLERIKHGSGIKDREDTSSGIEILKDETLANIKPTKPLK